MNLDMNLTRAMGKALSMIALGVPTFGRWPSPGRTEDEQKAATKTMTNIAQSYVVAIGDESKITPEIIEITARRYLQGKVTVFQNGTQVPASNEFPTAPQFRDACLQTWHEIYKMIAIGTTRNELGYEIDHTVVVKRGVPRAEVDALVQSERIKLGLQVSNAPELPIGKEEFERARAMVRKTFDE